MARKMPSMAFQQRAKRMTMEPSHENVIGYEMKKAQALKAFDIDKEAARMARRRAQKAAATAAYVKKVT